MRKSVVIGLISAMLLTAGAAYAVCGAGRSQYAFRIGGSLPGPINCRLPKCMNLHSLGTYLNADGTVGHKYWSTEGSHAGLPNCPAEVVWVQADPF